MALQSNAAFLSECEDDRQSVASMATSIWDGANNPPINALRKSQKAVSALHCQLTLEYARMKTVDEEEFKDKFVEVDMLRYNYGNQILQHVNLAQQITAENPTHAEFILGRVANSVGVFRDTWNKMSYFGQELWAHRHSGDGGDLASSKKRPRANI